MSTNRKGVHFCRSKVKWKGLHKTGWAPNTRRARLRSLAAAAVPVPVCYDRKTATARGMCATDIIYLILTGAEAGASCRDELATVVVTSDVACVVRCMGYITCSHR